EDDSEAPDVAPAIERGARRLLRGHVCVLALDDALLFRDEARLGDAEVRHLHRALVRDEDVLRRDVTGDDVERSAWLVAPAVRVVESLGGLQRDEGGER